ncbi:hypothetical protein BA1DRAFT_00178 [Photorhabdus aegyptia]|uniref:Uncharacterized protein n=1 Tax=Photorhabdus aegyptia TaxID=2805098 RepID=A0A022PLZ3_9GAMM|nr:hypothetical protein BA1DRAFT_00178 [Photorhabdus aegyptia]
MISDSHGSAFLAMILNRLFEKISKHRSLITALEHKIRTGLKQNAAFYPDMKHQQPQSPTARWIFLTFEGINIFEFQKHRMVTGIQPYQNALLKILG